MLPFNNEILSLLAGGQNFHIQNNNLSAGPGADNVFSSLLEGYSLVSNQENIAATAGELLPNQDFSQFFQQQGSKIADEISLRSEEVIESISTLLDNSVQSDNIAENTLVNTSPIPAYSIRDYSTNLSRLNIDEINLNISVDLTVNQGIDNSTLPLTTNLNHSIPINAQTPHTDISQQFNPSNTLHSELPNLPGSQTFVNNNPINNIPSAAPINLNDVQSQTLSSDATNTQVQSILSNDDTEAELPISSINRNPVSTNPTSNISNLSVEDTVSANINANILTNNASRDSNLNHSFDNNTTIQQARSNIDVDVENLQNNQTTTLNTQVAGVSNTNTVTENNENIVIPVRTQETPSRIVRDPLTSLVEPQTQLNVNNTAQLNSEADLLTENNIIVNSRSDIQSRFNPNQINQNIEIRSNNITPAVLSENNAVIGLDSSIESNLDTLEITNVSRTTDNVSSTNALNQSLSVNSAPTTHSRPILPSSLTLDLGQTPEINNGNDVARQIAWAQQNNAQNIRLSISPEHLGAIDISIDESRDGINVNFVTQNAIAKEALETFMPRLREMLEQSGLNLENANVTQHNDQQGSSEYAGHLADALSEDTSVVEKSFDNESTSTNFTESNPDRLFDDFA